MQRTEDKGMIKDRYIRIISIPLIGVLMPLLFYTSQDSPGLLIWIIFSTLLTLIAWETSRHVVSFLWKKYPWEGNPVQHLLISALFLTVLAVFLGLLVYYMNVLFGDVSDRYWDRMKGVHFSIVLLTFFTTSIYEAVFLFHKWKKALTLSAELERENIKSQFETLKNQVNPHFLFNSLNTLSWLIHENPEKAVEYVSEFSSIYRYVLDVKDLNAVKLKDELEFVQSYIYLQKIRFGDELDVSITIDPEKLDSLIMPLSLQVLIENAIKHNEISETYPLKIQLYFEDEYVLVKNSLKKISLSMDSPGTGLKNLAERYRLVTDRVPYFYSDEKEYTAGIPCIADFK
jgi:two-component system, LytTR family, sensor kinase